MKLNKTVLLIGLGNMGAALARTLLDAGYETWVWNRTKEKAGTLLEKGALWSENVWEAADHVDYIVMCLSNYVKCVEVLSTCSDLDNKALIQLSTGTASDAISFENMVKQKRGRYLDGAILAYPSNIGDPRSSLLIAGNSLVWKDCEALIMALGGKSRYLGEEVGAPSHLDHALIAPSLIMQMAVIQGMHMAKKAGVDLELYSMMISGLPVSLKTDQERHTRAIIDGDFSNVQASIRTWKEALDRILEEGKGSNFNVELLSGIGEVLRNGQDQGVGEEDLAALIKTMG